jgi:hypothetical protein
VVEFEVGRQGGVPGAVQLVDEVGEGVGVADFLDTEDVHTAAGDRRGESGKFGLVDGHVGGTEVAARAEKVLQIPRSE